MVGQDMEDEMENLLRNMESIGRDCDKVERDLEPNRARVEKLVSVSRLVKRLEFLFELPARLRQSIDMNAHAQASEHKHTSHTPTSPPSPTPTANR